MPSLRVPIFKLILTQGGPCLTQGGLGLIQGGPMSNSWRPISNSGDPCLTQGRPMSNSGGPMSNSGGSCLVYGDPSLRSSGRSLIRPRLKFWETRMSQEILAVPNSDPFFPCPPHLPVTTMSTSTIKVLTLAISICRPVFPWTRGFISTPSESIKNIIKLRMPLKKSAFWQGTNVCPRNLDLYYIKWVKTSWTYIIFTMKRIVDFCWQKMF